MIYLLFLPLPHFILSEVYHTWLQIKCNHITTWDSVNQGMLIMFLEDWKFWISNQLQWTWQVTFDRVVHAAPITPRFPVPTDKGTLSVTHPVLSCHFLPSNGCFVTLHVKISGSDPNDAARDFSSFWETDTVIYITRSILKKGNKNYSLAS